eukprot:12923151-Prorocentrum_lima.AAC.1
MLRVWRYQNPKLAAPSSPSEDPHHFVILLERLIAKQPGTRGSSPGVDILVGVHSCGMGGMDRPD